MKKSSALSRLRSMVQMVHDIVIDDDGNAKCTGADDDDELAPTVAYHFGFYSRPSNARGMVLKADGQGNTSFLIGFRDKQYELTLSKGEVGVKNEFGASTLWDKNGNIVSLPGGAGTVQLGGSTYALPTWDPFITVLAACASTIAGLTTATDPATVITLANGIKAAFVMLNAALSANSNYKSTKAKNG